MFTTTGSRGLYKAPLCKGLLLVLNGLTVMLTLLPQYQDMFVYSLQAVIYQHQVCLRSRGQIFSSHPIVATLSVSYLL
ncbi:Ubiquitin-associated domain-containing protein 2 [Ameca splendens]|uniref:Ubiquitin-associated domain-containing protein 2 n=1 Tax=Ameca splendens TaxID=208324 RepID=A0ABV1A2R9_9TELE